jgi:hypothetical protein
MAHVLLLLGRGVPYKRCLVIWHRLVSALHLNGSLGEVKDLCKDSTGHTFVSSRAMVNGGEHLSRIRGVKSELDL